MTTKEKFREGTAKDLGHPLDTHVFDLAYAKAKRWANAAYGAPNMESFAGESGYTVAVYYEECAAGVKSTFNRESFGASVINRRNAQERRS